MQNINLADSFIGIANRHGDRPAIISGQDRITFRQLMGRSFQTARMLQSEGVAAGDRVGLAIRSNVDLISTAIGLWCLGGTAIVLDFRSTQAERDAYTKSIDIKMVLSSGTSGGQGDASTVRLDQDWLTRLARMNDDPVVPDNGGHPALILLTSGTTGVPTGVQWGHHTLLLRNLLEQTGAQTNFDGTLVFALPLNYAAPFNKAIGHLLNGGTLEILPFLATASDVVEHVNSHNVENLFVVPKQLRELLALSPDGKEQLLPHLKALINGGAATSAADNIGAIGRLSSHYKMTYASSLTGVISELSGKDVEAHPGSAGRVHHLNNVIITDAEGHTLPFGEEGVIRFRGPAMAEEIVGPARHNSDRFSNGWAIPGDIGRIDETGLLMLCGRNSEVIIRGGANVYPTEIENCIMRLSGIRDVAVTGIPDRMLGEEIAAFVVSDRGVGEQAILAHVRANLSPDKCPRHVVLLEVLPKNSMGKTLKMELHLPEAK